MKLLHLCPNEKFINDAVSLFEDANSDSTWFVFGSEKGHTKKSYNVHFKKRNELISPSFLLNARKYDVIFMHMFDNAYIPLLFSLPRSTKVVWIGWGADYYQRRGLKANFDLFTTLTKAKFARKVHKLQEDSFVSRFFSPLLMLAIKKIDFFCPVLLEEYGMIFKNTNGAPVLLDWNYPAKLYNSDDESSFENKSSIILGNSSSLTNNHLDAIKVLSTLDIKSKVICPLSYGDTEVSSVVKAELEAAFGSNAFPLSSFMPVNEYLDLLDGVGAGIFNNKRQEALANINFLISKGAKVYLNGESPSYNFYTSRGYKVFKVDELLQENHHFYAPLELSEVEKNRRLVAEDWSYSASLIKTKQLIKTIEEKVC